MYVSCFKKVCNIQKLNTLKTILVYYWFFCTPQRGGSSFLSWHLSFFCLYCWLYEIIHQDYMKVSLNISAHLSIKIILVDPNLVRTFLVIIFLILIMVRTLENNYFLVRTKLGYLRYYYFYYYCCQYKRSSASSVNKVETNYCLTKIHASRKPVWQWAKREK